MDWKQVDKELEKYLKCYTREQKILKDEINDIFTAYEFTNKNINSFASNEIRDKFKRYLSKKIKNISKDTNLYLIINKLLSKSQIRNRLILQTLIMIKYFNFNENTKEYENTLFSKTAQISYDNAVRECKKMKNKRIIDNFDVLLLGVLALPNNLGYIWQDYLDQMLMYNSNELYRQLLIDIQRGINLDINNSYYQQLFKKQRNRQISINDGKTSGAIDNEVSNIASQVSLEVGKQYDMEQCRFIAEIDKRTTDMCESLNNQLFYLNKMNVYQRHSAADDKMVVYHTKGLVLGDNLPPINNHFHYCRSTITYQIDKDIRKMNVDITNKWLKKKRLFGKHYEVNMLDNVFLYKGKKYIIDGHNVKYEFRKGEKEFAVWLSNNSNKKITLLPKINVPESIKTPDYIIDNEYFDYKYTTGASNQLIFHNLYGKESQSSNFIIEINNKKLSMADLYEQVEYTYKKLNWVDKIAIKKEENFVIFKRK